MKKIIKGMVGAAVVLTAALTISKGIAPCEKVGAVDSVKTDNETMLQAYEWYLDNDGKYWNEIGEEADAWAQLGISSVWLPPAYKGMSGASSVGYDPYDLYDLGEFNQKGTVRTKYGTKNEYIAAIDKLHAQGIKVYADIVLNHKAGADSYESVPAYKVNGYNRLQNISSSATTIYAWTKFDFPGRKGKYSSFIWDKSCFDGVDYDQKTKQNAIYRFSGKSWDTTDLENGNYDYLMFADLDLNSTKVRNELKSWGKWYVETAKLDGFRIDAVKHMEFSFVGDWIKSVEKSTGKDLFAVGEYYSGYTSALTNYIKETDRTTTLFDFPLYYKFKEAGINYNLNNLKSNTLTSADPNMAITFVENHDTQIGQSSTTVKKWFKPLAYTYILTRQEGQPCVFYGDLYGSGNGKTVSIRKDLNNLLIARKHFAYGKQVEKSGYNGTVMGWSRQGDSIHKDSGLAALISTNNSGTKTLTLNVGKSHAGEVWYDITGNVTSKVTINSSGVGTFKVKAMSWSVYVKESAISKYVKVEKVTGLKCISKGTTSVRLRWNEINNATGYKVFQVNSSTGKWYKVADVATNEVVIKKLPTGTRTRFLVRAYKRVGSKYIEGGKSGDVLVVTKPNTPVLKVAAGAKKAVLSWNKSSSTVNGYYIYMATSKNGTYKKVSTISGGNNLKKTITGLKSGNTYYFKIIAFRKYKADDGTYKYSNSSYSTVKYVKIK